MPTKNYYESVIQDSGLTPVEAEDLQAKFDAITQAEYDQQRTNLQTATNQYYNQLYNTQQTTMDTIRQANAQAVASGASRGVQAANELSALLGLQSEAVTGATDLANQATTLAQDETQAMLENMLNAETQAAEQNQALAQILTQAGSVDVEQQNADTAAEQVQQQWQQLIEQIRQTNPTLANQLQTEYNAQYADTNNSTDTGASETESTVADPDILSGKKGLTATLRGQTETRYITESAPVSVNQVRKIANDKLLSNQFFLSMQAGLPAGDIDPYSDQIPDGAVMHIGGGDMLIRYKGEWYRSDKI